MTRRDDWAGHIDALSWREHELLVQLEHSWAWQLLMPIVMRERGVNIRRPLESVDD